MKGLVKRYGLRVLGLIAGFAGLVVAIVAFHDLLIRTVAIFVCLAGIYVAKKTKASDRSELHEVGVDRSYSVNAKHIKLAIWIACAFSLVASGTSFAFMYKDALNGYQEDWPIYAFIISISIFALTSSYIVAYLVKQMLSR
jgi:hypothetical protein